MWAKTATYVYQAGMYIIFCIYILVFVYVHYICTHMTVIVCTSMSISVHNIYNYLCTYNIVKLEIVIIHEQAWATFQDRGVTWSMPVSYPEPASLHADKEVTYLVVWGWGMKTLNTGNLKKLLYKVSNLNEWVGVIRLLMWKVLCNTI